MTIEIITDYQGFLDLRSCWDKVVENMSHPEVFYLFAWTDNYLKYYAPEQQKNILIGLVKDGNDIVAIFPFSYKDKKLAFLVKNTADYNTIYISKEYNALYIIREVLKKIIANVKIASICLANIPDSSTLFLLQQAFRDVGYIAILQESAITPYFCKENQMIDKSQKKHMKDIERRERRMKEESVIEYQHGSDISSQEWAFTIDSKIKRYPNSPVANQNVQQFYWHLAKDLNEYVEFDAMYNNQKLVATHFGFLYRSKLYYYMPSFSDESGVGLMLLKNSLEEVGYSIFDSLIGNEAYKFYWCTNAKMNFHLLAYDSKIETLFQRFLIRLKNSTFIRKVFGR